MATLTVGDTVNGETNNVTGIDAGYADIQSAEAVASAADTIQCIRNANLSGAAVLTIDVQVTLTAHDDCAVNAPTYAALISRARYAKDEGGDYHLRVTASGVIIEKLGFINTYAGDGIYFGAPGTLRRCVVRTPRVCVRVGHTTGLVSIENCAIISTSSGGDNAITLTNTGTLRCTHVSTWIGTGNCFAASIDTYDFEAYACVGMNSSGTVFNNVYGGQDFNVSSDATAPGTTNWRSRTNIFKNTTAGSEDLSMYAPVGGYMDVDDYSSSADVGTDIMGTTRAGYIDPGCFQYGATVALTTGCVHGFKFDNSLDDVVGSVDLTNESTTFDASVKKLGTHSLDATGASQRVYLADADYNAPTTGMTVWLWFRGGDVTDKGLIGKGTSGACTFAIHSENASNIRCYIGNAGTEVSVSIATGGHNVIDEWHCVALTYNGTLGTAHAFFWRTATPHFANQRVTSGLPSSLYNSTADFEIGRARSVYSSTYSDHRFDSVYIWNRELNGAELAAMYNAGTGLDPTFSVPGKGFPFMRRYPRFSSLLRR